MMYTAWAEYCGTGEGVTHMLLFTRGYGQKETWQENVRDTFVHRFGSYFAVGVEMCEGLKLDTPFAEHMISERAKNSIIRWQDSAGGLEYAAELHVNFS